MQYYKANLSVEASWLIESGVMTEATYQNETTRDNMRVVRRGCRGVSALVDYESLPDRFKARIVDMLGNPYDYVKENALLKFLTPSTEAADFFDSYLIDGVRHLPVDTIRRYHADACVLDAIGRFIGECNGKSSALGHRKVKLWDELSMLIATLDNQRWPHALPSNARSLERKYKAYQKGGYAALIHRGWLNSNAAKITASNDKDALLALVSDPRNLTDTMVMRLYNESHADAPITERVVSNFRINNEQDIYARRHGATDFRANRLMTVKRSAPSAPLYLWTLDGWDAELLYQKTSVDKRDHSVTTYHNRVKLEVVLDACTKYPIGYAIGDTESPELIREALRNAINHTAALFGSRYKPAQIQMDHAGYKSLKDFYAQTAVHVTPAAVRNAKAKVIEPWFRQFNDRYCHLQTNWSGYGLTARKENQPNKEYINKYRHSFPDRDGVVAQLERFINMERERLHDDYLQRWNAMPPENRFPMSDEQYLMTYGTATEHRYLMRNTGICMTIEGRKHDFDCFDHEFRRHASVRWKMLFDADDTSKALAVSEDGSLRFLMEEKHLQPMALIERSEGDAAALQRVRNFNRAEEKRITDIYAAIEDVNPLRIDAAADNIEKRSLQAATEFETLSKLLIVDSDGQHKRQRDAARIAMDGDISDLY